MGRTQNFFYLIHLYWVEGETRDTLFCPKPLVCVCLQSWAVSPGVCFKTQGNRTARSGQVRSGESRLRPSYASDNFLLPRPVMRPAPEEHNGHTGFLKGPFLGPEEPGVTGHLHSQPGKAPTQHSFCTIFRKLLTGGSLLTALSILVPKPHPV